MSRQRRVRISFFALLWLVGIGLAAASAFQLAQRPAEEYIKAMDNPDRDLRVDQVIAKLKLKPRDIVADIGSGSGAFSIPMARAIAPNGTLYAVDIDHKMLDYV